MQPRKLLLLIAIAGVVSFVAVFNEMQKYQMRRPLTSWKHTRRADIVTTPKMDLCPRSPPGLLGEITADIKADMPLDTLNASADPVRFGGWWKPANCTARMKVAILVPYRARPQQLTVFLKNMIPVFQRQLLEFKIFIIEQAGTAPFNKGAIYNIGFNFTLAHDDYDCFIFHDVDLIAENDLNYYGCPSSPRHMSVAIDKFQYKLPYPLIFGGIQAFTKQDYIATNGYSNKFYGWGAEDDDLYRRVKNAGLNVTRPSLKIGRYKMNRYHHRVQKSAKLYKKNEKVFFSKQDVYDGLHNISSLTFTTKVHEERFCTFISVDIMGYKW